MENSINIESCTAAIESINESLGQMNSIIENDLAEDANDIKKSWESDNAAVFTNKVNSIIESLRGLKASIDGINKAVAETKNTIVRIDSTASAE